jgi:hypothetical protein
MTVTPFISTTSTRPLANGRVSSGLSKFRLTIVPSFAAILRPSYVIEFLAPILDILSAIHMARPPIAEHEFYRVVSAYHWTPMFVVTGMPPVATTNYTECVLF